MIISSVHAPLSLKKDGKKQALSHFPEDFFDFAANTDETSGVGTYYPVGSLIVKAGCTYYGYDQDNYAGNVYRYDGPLLFADAGYVDTDECSTG